jgi:hypothetical protein
MQYDNLIECSRCSSDACYTQEITPEVKLEFCYGCGFQSHSLMKPGTEFFTEQLALLPDLYKSLIEEEEETGKVWMPSFINVVEPFLNDEIKIRAENNHFNIFCKHKILLDSMSTALDKWAYAVHSPETQEEIDYLLDNRNQKILCDKLPHSDYKFKIILRDRMKLDTRKNFLTWAKKYGNSILISKTTEFWLDGKTMYKQDPFFYIKNDSLLTMMMLFLSNDIRKVHEYVIRNTITEE